MRRFAGWAAVALALLALAAGCGNRGGSLTGYSPEGHVAAQLTAQVDTSGGSLFASALVFAMVPTNRIRLYDSVNGQGYVPIDGELEPVRVFSTNWAIYRATLSSYDPTVSHVLVGRGSRDGMENALSPITNPAGLPAGDASLLVAPRDTVPLAPRAPRDKPDAAPSIPIDSLYLHMGTVAGANTIFLEIVKGAVTHYLARFDRQPDNSFSRTEVFENIAPDTLQTYAWHLDEYNGEARLIAATSVNGSFSLTRPKVFGPAFRWPTDSSHLLFEPWTIPVSLAQVRPPRR